MSRTARFLSGLTYGYAFQALLLVVGLWLTPFYLDHLGQHTYGLWLVATQILGYLMLSDLGVVALLPRETAYEVGRQGGIEEARELPVLIGKTLRLILWQLPAVVLIAGGIWFLMPEKWLELRPALAALLVAFVILFPLRIFRAILQGVQDLRFLGRVQIAIWTFGTVITVVLVILDLGLLALVFGWIANQIASAAILWLRLRREYPTLLPSSLPRVDGPWARRYLGSGLWMSGGQVAQAMLASTDMMILGAVLSPAAAVPYAVTAKLIQILANQPQMVMQLAIPGLSELRTSAEPRHLLDVSRSLTQAMLIGSGLVVCVVLAVNEGFVGWWVGAELFSGAPLTYCLVALMLLRHWNTTLVFTILSFGYERWIALTTLADGILTVGAGILLTHWIGPLGVPIASLAGVVLISLPLNLRAVCRETHSRLPDLLLPLLPWTWRFALGVAGGLALARWLRPTGFVELAIATVAAGSFYVMVISPLLFRAPLDRYVRPRIDGLKDAWRRRGATS